MAKTQDENLITFLLGDSSIAAKLGTRLTFNHFPADTAFPRAYFTRTATERDGCLDDAAGDAPTRERFQLELQTEDQRQTEDLRKLVEARLNCYRGTFGDTTVSGIFAEQQNSGHDPRGTGRDNGLFTATFDVEVIL